MTDIPNELPPLKVDREPPKPLAYGLRNLDSGIILTDRVYRKEETADAAAKRLSNQWHQYVAIPLFGPEAFLILGEQLRSSRHAENYLRNEAIELRNQLMTARGKEVARAHAAGEVS